MEEFAMAVTRSLLTLYSIPVKTLFDAIVLRKSVIFSKKFDHNYKYDINCNFSSRLTKTWINFLLVVLEIVM